MRLDKVAYLFGAHGELKGYDSLGRPVYAPAKADIPFEMSWEPYSPDKSKSDYGTVVTCRYRMFTYPDSRLTLNTQLVAENSIYKITQVMTYEKHAEILIDYVGAYTG